jgi:hypothetical protein
MFLSKKKGVVNYLDVCPFLLVTYSWKTLGPQNTLDTNSFECIIFWLIKLFIYHLSTEAYNKGNIGYDESEATLDMTNSRRH